MSKKTLLNFLKISLREYNFTANNINQKPSIIKQRSKIFYLFHLKSKFSASLSRSHYQSIKNLTMSDIFFPCFFLMCLKTSLREFNFTANNINQKPSIIKQRSKMFYLFHLKSKFSASFSRSHYQSIKNLTISDIYFPCFFLMCLKISLREYSFTANNINQKPSIIKQRPKMFYLFHLKSKFLALLSRSHYQSIENFTISDISFPCFFLMCLKMFLREYNFTANNINQKPSIKKQRPKMFY